MTVKQLREHLKAYADDVEIVMSKDSEGNSFSPLCDVANAIYVPETTWYGEIYDETEHEGDDGEMAVVLWPTN